MILPLYSRFKSWLSLLAILIFLLSGCENNPVAKDQVVAIGDAKANSIGMTFVYLPRGSFRMGSFDNPMERPVHNVEVSGFWMAQVLVTNAQFDLFKKRPRFPEFLLNNQPAMRVERADAIAFCEWLSKKEKRRYRLPTEAEWEYAARGGLDQKDYPWGNEPVKGRACFNRMITCPVGSYPPNAFKLYDMVGNACQWVSDYYSEEYYADSPPFNPQGPPKSNDPRDQFYVLRGGNCGFFEFKCSERMPCPFDVESIAGFRVVLEGKASAFTTVQPVRPFS